MSDLKKGRLLLCPFFVCIGCRVCVGIEAPTSCALAGCQKQKKRLAGRSGSSVRSCAFPFQLIAPASQQHTNATLGSLVRSQIPSCTLSSYRPEASKNRATEAHSRVAM